jgi:uncharacterized cofD-like protein
VRDDPAVVAVGGGHGLAATLRALRQLTRDVTAVVSVADDGGSTGRLRRDLGVLGVGDLRKCLGALAADPDTPWAEAFRLRFGAGELEGHAFGNLALVALAEVTGDWLEALRLAGELLGTVGAVLPATAGPVEIVAEVGAGEVRGQVAVQNAAGRIRRVALAPADAASPPEVVTAIGRADLVVLAPGSLYTSVLPALAAPDVAAALAASVAPVIAVVNLGPQAPETVGLDVADHLRAVLDAGIRVDHAVVDQRSRLVLDRDAVAGLGVTLSVADVARPDVAAHEPARLAPVLAALLESRAARAGRTTSGIGQRRPEEES